MAPAAVVSLLIAAVLATPAPEAPGERPGTGWLSGLGPSVEEAASGFDGELSLYVLEVESGESYAYDADTQTYLSSAIKIAVMLEVLHQVELQQLSWDELLELRPEDLRDGMHRLGGARPGIRLPVATLLEYMMGDSDNAAADLLIRRVGLERIKAQLAARGIQTGPLLSLLEERQRIYARLDPRAQELAPAQIQALGQQASLASRARFLSELMEHSPAWAGRDLDRAFSSFYEEKVNSASMRQMGRLLAQVARCEGLSEEGCTRAHNLMRACRTGRGRIAAGLPKTAAWAHKTGTQHRRACDLGILELRPGQTIVIAACTRRFWHVADAERLFSRLGQLISDAASTPPPRG